MEMTSILCLMVILLLFYYWYRRPYKMPPGPRGIPILGYMPFVGKLQQNTAYKLSKKHGPVVSIRLGREDLVFLNDYDSIVQALVKESTKFSGRPPNTVKPKSPDKGIIFHDYDDHWKSQRRFGIKTLRGYGFGKKSMEDFCLEELSNLLEAIRSEKGKPFDMSSILHKAVSNNICSIVLGKRFEYDDEKFNEILELILSLFKNSITMTIMRIATLVPQLQKVPPISTYGRHFQDKVLSVIQDWLMSIVDDHEEGFDKHDLRDFIDTYIAEIQKGKDLGFRKGQLLQYVYDLFMGGTETTSSTLLWSLLCLLHYPESQTKLRKEIFEVIGPSGKVSYANREKFPYTNAFIHEMMRYKTLLPLGAIHKTTEQAELYGYVIPKGTKVVPNIWAVHNDTEFWKEPNKFIPERFLDEEGNFVASSHVIPFSVGPRHCLGEQLARMEFFMFLVKLVQKFEFVPDPEAEQLPDFETSASGMLYVPLPYKLVAKEL